MYNATEQFAEINKAGYDNAVKLATMSLKSLENGLYEMDLPIGSIARGEYVFEIVASRGADQAKTLVSFRVN